MHIHSSTSHGDKLQSNTLVAIHYWREWFIQLTRTKQIEAAAGMLSQHGAATATTSSLWGWETNLERKREEGRKANTSFCLSLDLTEKKKRHHGWTAPTLMSSISGLAITLAVDLPIQPSAHYVFLQPATRGVCIKDTTRYWSAVCIAIGCITGQSSEATTKWRTA